MGAAVWIRGTAQGVVQRMGGVGGPDAGREGVALPPEVLGAPVDGGQRFVDRMDEWRRALGWTHNRFAAYLGISRNYWWLLRTHQRELTIGVAQRVVRERPEFEYFLGSWVRERTWGHRPGQGDTPGDSPAPGEEVAPEGH